MSTRVGMSLTIKSLPKVEQTVRKVEGEKEGVCAAYIRQRKLEKGNKYLREEAKDSPHISKKELARLEQEHLEQQHSMGNDDEIAYMDSYQESRDKHSFPEK